MKWNVTIFNKTFPKNTEVIEVEAPTQKEAERIAISSRQVCLQSGWGVMRSEPIDGLLINKPHLAETIKVTLTPEKYPIAFERKVKELMGQGAFNTKEEAEKWVKSTPIVLELYYEIDAGLFAVESEALESSPESICSPYSKEPFIEQD